MSYGCKIKTNERVYNNKGSIVQSTDMTKNTEIIDQ